MKLQLNKTHKSLFYSYFRPTVLHDHAASRLVKKSQINVNWENNAVFHSFKQLPKGDKACLGLRPLTSFLC